MKQPSKALVAKWYAKAKKAGFDDIEQNDERERLKKWHSGYLQSRYTPAAYEAKEQYFRLASHLLEHGAFDNKRHKRIWGMHADGATIKEIAKAVKTNETAVYQVIVQYRKSICK